VTDAGERIGHQVQTGALLDSISVGVDRMERNFAPVQKQVEAAELSTVAAKMVVC